MTDHVMGTRDDRRLRLELLELEKEHPAPKGRDEDNVPAGQWWWRRHDEYEDG